MESPSESQNNPQSTTSTSNPPAKAASAKKTFIIGIGAMLVLALLVAGGVGAYRIYTATAQDAFSVAVARTLRLPIARVNGSSITYYDYITDLKALETIVAFDKQDGNALGLNTLTEEQKSDQVLIRLASNILLQELAEKYDVKVESSDLGEMRKQIITGSDTQPTSSPSAVQTPTFKTEAEASAELKKRYGWDYKMYEQRVIVPFILQNKLSKKIEEDFGAKETLRKKAQDVLDQVKKGGNFEELARQYSDDPGSKANGGNLDWFGKGVMVPQFEEAAYKLKKDEVSPELVETQYGYHIIRVDDRGMRDSTDPITQKKVKTDQVKARHILFAFPTFDQVFNNFGNAAVIEVKGKVHDPFKQLQSRNASSTAK